MADESKKSSKNALEKLDNIVNPEVDNVEDTFNAKLQKQQKELAEQRKKEEAAEKQDNFADKAKNTIKTAKKAANVGATAAKAGALYQSYSMIKSMMMFLANLATAVTGSISGAVGGIASVASAIWGFLSNALHAIAGAVAAGWHALTGVVGSVLAVGSTASSIIAGGIVGVSVLGAGMTGVSMVDSIVNDPAQWDANLPDCAVAIEKSMGKLNKKDMDKAQLDNAKKIYSVLKVFGLTDNEIGGILGNWSVESGIDPTSVEGIFSEKYEFGPKKAAALADHNNYTLDLLDQYAKRGMSVYRAQYLSKNDGEYWPGVGLLQITPADRIVIPAENLGRKWYDLDFQIAYILAMGSSITTGRGGNQEYFANYKQKMANASASMCAANFLDEFEGCPGHSSLPSRQRSAESWAKQFESWSVDKSYAESIMSLAKKLGMMASDKAIAAAKDKCVKLNKRDNSNIANALAAYAWPSKEESYNDGTDLYQEVYLNIWGGRIGAMRSCDVGISTAVRWSGSDINYPAYSCAVQEAYVASSPKWRLVGPLSALKLEDLRPGDIALLPGHTWGYVGKEIIQRVHGLDNNGTSVSASKDERSPGVGTDANFYLSRGGADELGRGVYNIYRLVNPDNSDKYKNAGAALSKD